MALNSFVLVVLAFPIISSSSATGIRPGFESRVTQKGIDFLRGIGIQKMKEKVYSMDIPPQSGETHGVSYEVYNMRVTNFDISSSNINLEAGNGFRIDLSGITVSLEGRYHYSVFVISKTGDLEVSISSMSTSFSVEINEECGRPTVYSSTGSCQFDAGSVYVHLQGSSSHDGEVSEAVENALNENACNQIVNGINQQLEEKLSQLQMTYPIRQILDLDYSILSPPFIKGTFMDIRHKGEIYPINMQEECPLPIPKLPSDSDVSRMIFVWITDYVANSAGYFLHKYGHLWFDVTEKDIPPGSKLSLNTSSSAIKFVFPKVTKLYPGKLMQFNVKSTAPPTMNTTSKEVIVAVKGNISAYVQQPNASLTYLFTLSSQLSLSFKLNVNHGNVTWKSNLVSHDVKLVETAIKDFNIDKLKMVLPFALKHKVIPMLNEKGTVGIAIPSYDDVKAVNTTVQLGPGYIKIGTNFATIKKDWNILNFLFGTNFSG